MRRFALIVSLVAAAGCGDCGGGGSRTIAAEVKVGPDLQFGTVRIGEKKTLTFQVVNEGSAPMTIEAFEVPLPFKVETVAPVDVLRAETLDVQVTYEPTEPNVTEAENHVAQLVVVNNTETNPRAAINVVGHAVKPNFVVEPATMEFGDVNAGTIKDLTLTIENRGNERVEVIKATLESQVFSGNTKPLETVFSQGTKIAVLFSYLPTAGRVDEATLVLQTNSPSVPELRIPFTGRGLAAKVQLCYGFPGEQEICLPRKDAQGNDVWAGEIQFGALDEGTSRSATVTLKNEGNVAVTLVPLAGTGTMVKDVTANKQSLCGLPAPRQADFGFDPVTFGETLGGDTTVPMTVTYTPHHDCMDDLTDSGVIMFRAGGQGAPTFRIDLRGSSRLGLVQADNVFWQVDRPDQRPYYVKNVGFGPLHVDSVEMVEGDAGEAANANTDCSKDCETRPSCTGSTHPECQPFRWVVAPPANGVDIAPATLGTSGEAIPTSGQCGQIEFVPPKRCSTAGQTDCLQLPQVFKLCARIKSNDPYRKTVCGELKAKAL